MHSKLMAIVRVLPLLWGFRHIGTLLLRMTASVLLKLAKEK
jgi:hypothetical protein